MFTVDGEVNPRSVDTDIIAAVKKQHWALVPALVWHPDIWQLDRRLADGSNAAVERRVHARRVSVVEDEDGSLDTDFAPRDDGLDVDAARVAHLTLEYPTWADRGRLAQRPRRSLGRRRAVVLLLRLRHTEVFISC